MNSNDLRHGEDFVGIGCGALIVNNKNEVLLLKRGNKSRNNAGFWSQPGGRVDYGETVIEAIKREVREEVGVEIILLKFLCYSNQILKRQRQHWVTINYLAKITKGRPKIMEPQKHDDLQWFDLKKVPKLESITRETIRAYLAE
jgi:mutator protein MutT